MRIILMLYSHGAQNGNRHVARLRLGLRPCQEAFEAEAESFLAESTRSDRWISEISIDGTTATLNSRRRNWSKHRNGRRWNRCWIRMAVRTSAYGGRNFPLTYQRRYEELRATYPVPDLAAFTISLGMVAPTILAHGSDTARSRYLNRLHRGDILACQLFSEPGAGSDLASVRTSALRDGDGWVINGQKVWSSRAHLSDIGEIVVRTDPLAPRHKGLTAFLIDMAADGVEVRPLRQMTGGARFNEVFLTDVRVKDDHRLGDVNNGWSVALTTLANDEDP